jgi:hypothetical protein
VTGCAHHGEMEDSASTPSTSGSHGSEQAPESYRWPLTALVLVILPQVLVPANLREGPPLLVPVVEGCVALILLAVAAKPGPVPRGARPLILTLFAVLIVANTAAAVRLVTVMLRNTPSGEAPPTVTQLRSGRGSCLPPTSSPSDCSTGRLTAAGPPGAWFRPRTMPLTHRVKGLMAIQSLISLFVIGLVLSRVINILPP